LKITGIVRLGECRFRIANCHRKILEERYNWSLQVCPEWLLITDIRTCKKLSPGRASCNQLTGTERWVTIGVIYTLFSLNILEMIPL